LQDDTEGRSFFARFASTPTVAHASDCAMRLCRGPLQQGLHVLRTPGFPRSLRSLLRSRPRRLAAQPHQGGFTLVELLIVIAIVALGVGLVSMALPDGEASKLEEEGARLSSLLEAARAEARVAGVPVRWVPRPSQGGDEATIQSDVAQFQFVGLPVTTAMSTRFLDHRTQAQVVGANHLILGPEAILPSQRVTLRLGERKLELVSDGLGPFSTLPLSSPPPPGSDAGASRGASP
jgi:general secretion pathway protein H